MARSMDDEFRECLECQHTKAEHNRTVYEFCGFTETRVINNRPVAAQCQCGAFVAPFVPAQKEAS